MNEEAAVTVSADLALVVERMISMVGELERRQQALERQHLELHQDLLRLTVAFKSLESGVEIQTERNATEFKKIALILAKVMNFKQVRDTGVRN